MKSSTRWLVVASVLIAAVTAHGQQRPGAVPWVPPDSPHGTGRYKAIMEMDAMLPTHTVYRPADLAQLGDMKLPIIFACERKVDMRKFMDRRGAFAALGYRLWKATV